MRPRFLQFPRPGQQLRLLRPFLRGQRLRVWRPSWIGQRLSFGDPPGTGNGSGSRGPFDPILKPECPVSASSSRCVSLSTKGYSEFGPGSGSGYGDPPGSVRGVRSGDPLARAADMVHAVLLTQAVVLRGSLRTQTQLGWRLHTSRTTTHWKDGEVVPRPRV